MTEAEWWRNAVIYEIYPRSFSDSDGDGVGDIAGMTQRLPYLDQLGVDAVWVTPWYRSPMADGGYDIADYQDVDPLFGTLDDATEFITQARQRGIRVLIDLVPNHTSQQHPWFLAALDSPSGSPERARYWFRAGGGTHGDLPPNNWRSVFGGSAWSRSTRDATGEWYLHLFAREQPDLNWTDPSVHALFLTAMRFWLELGVDGFRIDVAHGLSKDPALPDLPPVAPGTGSALDPLEVSGAEVWAGHPHWDRDDNEDILRAWRALLNEHSTPEAEKVLVAEAWRLRPRGLARYLAPDKLHTAFNLHFLGMTWSATDVAARITQHLDLLEPTGAPATWVLGSHDITRVASRLGRPRTWAQRRHRSSEENCVDAGLGVRRARAAALLTLALPGSCYVYQGEELGLPEVEDLPDDLLADPTWERSGHTVRGRDGCRVPLPWTSEPPSFGFGEGSPWLPIPGTWATLSVDHQHSDPDSTLSLYRDAIRLRRYLRDHVPARLTALTVDDGIRFARGAWECVLTFGDASPIHLDDAEILLSSVPLIDRTVGPDTCVWLWRGKSA